MSQLLDLLEQTAWLPIPEPGSVIYADCFYKPESAEEVRESRDRLIEVYRRAEDERMGILFTDFNDAGVSRL